MKRIILANLNGHKLSFLLKLSAVARPKRKERLFSKQIIPRKKILPWGLMALRESNLNGYCPKRKSPYLRFGRRQDLKGERRKPIYWCMPIELTLLFLSFLSFLLCFLSYLFSFLLALFFFSPPKIYSVFRSPLKGTARTFL